MRVKGIWWGKNYQVYTQTQILNSLNFLFFVLLFTSPHCPLSTLQCIQKDNKVLTSKYSWELWACSTTRVLRTLNKDVIQCCNGCWLQQNVNMRINCSAAAIRINLKKKQRLGMLLTIEQIALANRKHNDLFSSIALFYQSHCLYYHIFIRLVLNLLCDD